MALPEKYEDINAFFSHHPQSALPFIEDRGVSACLVAGSSWGGSSPLEQFSDMFYIDVNLDAFASVPLPDEHEDRAIHVMQGEIIVAGQSFETGKMLIFRPGDKISIKAGSKGARVIMLGGATLEGPRYIWWNFVSSSLDKIEAAKKDWAAGEWEKGRFQLPFGDEDEYIPLLKNKFLYIRKDKMSIRPVKTKSTARPAMEGAGVHLHRVFGFGDTKPFDPFLMMDDFRNDHPSQYKKGFPWHPHRGIETITYVLKGTVAHADSLGNFGDLSDGDIQWMTAGSGIIHQEMPMGDKMVICMDFSFGLIFHQQRK